MPNVGKGFPYDMNDKGWRDRFAAASAERKTREADAAELSPLETAQAPAPMDRGDRDRQ
jgi:hypothetical protein